jgi:homoserine O-acetyltransferase
MPGSCYGSTGPLDINPETGKPYFRSFPFFTSLDMAKSFQFIKNSLGIQKIHIGIGGSMGGQQLLAWACLEPELFEYIIPIATNAIHSPWGKAFNASQRMSIEADPTWGSDNPDAGKEGLKVARSIALISYRHYDTYGTTQQDGESQYENFKSDSYQRYQGEKIAKRFNAFSYYTLTKSMDSHHLGRGFVDAKEALGKIKSKCLVIGISSDILFPITEQEFIAENIENATLEIIDSIYGHDGFLLENEIITSLLKKLTT